MSFRKFCFDILLYLKDVVPDPQENCGPYSQPQDNWSGSDDNSGYIRSLINEHNHDTIGIMNTVKNIPTSNIQFEPL